MNNIVAVVLIISSVGLFFGYTNPLWHGDSYAQSFEDKSVKELQFDVMRYEEALNKAREIEEIRNGLLTKYNSISEEDRKRIMKFLPDHIDSVRLIIDINNIAGAYGMSLNGIKLSDPVGVNEPRRDEIGLLDISSRKEYQAKILDFVVSGPYENFIAFLKDAEKSLRLVDILSLSISADSKESSSSGASDYEYTVSLRTYYLNTNK